MTFYPAIPLSGFLGWRVFEQSEPKQKEIFVNEPTVIKNVAHFKENVRTALTAADLVNDRRLMTVALGAFGLEDEINKKALIRRVLEEGTEKSDAFANRLTDQRWRDFSDAFGYGNLAGPRVLLSEFRESIAQRYIDRAFESRVGDVNTDMRLAMNFRRDAVRIAGNAAVDRIGWFEIIGQRPLRVVMETALGLPSSVGTVDIDKQKQLFELKFKNLFGADSLSSLSDPEMVDAVLKRFFLQSEIQNGPSASTPGMAAVSILTGLNSTPSQTINLFISNLA